MSEVLSDKDMEKLKPIIEYLEANDEITPEAARTVTNKSDATVRRYLNILVEAGVLSQQGKTNNVTYVKNK